MESLIINHQRRRKVHKAPAGLISDHIIPYSISLDDSPENIQFLTKREHKLKTIIDFKIIKEFRKRGWIEKITHYSHELKVEMEVLKKEYKRLFKTAKTCKTGTFV